MKKNFENIKIVEKSFIAALFIGSGQGLENINGLKASDFYDQKYRQIYEAIIEVCGRNEKLFESSLIISKLQEKDKTVTDWQTEIAEIIAFTPSTFNISDLSKKIKEESDRRQTLSKFSDMANSDKSYLELKADAIKLAQRLEEDNLLNFQFLRLSQIAAKKMEFYLQEFLPLPARAVTMISARGGSGKSMLAGQISLRLATQKIKTLSWLSEDPLYITKNRLEKVSKILNIEINDGCLYFTDAIPPQFILKNNRELTINPIFYEFKAACKDFQVVILDPLIAFYGGEENSNNEARFFMNLLTEWANKNNKSIVLIHHHAKGKADKQDARGASAFTDAVRVHYSIEPHQDKDDNRYVKVSVEKDNWGVKRIFGNEKSIQIWPEKYPVSGTSSDANATDENQKKKGRPRTKYRNCSQDEEYDK